MLWLWKFVTFTIYLLAIFFKVYMVRNAINCKLWYFCQVYPIKFCYFSVVSILCKIKWSPLDIVIHPRYYLPHFTSPIKKVFELVLTGNNTKKSKNTVMQKKYIKHSILLKMLTSAKMHGQYTFFKYFFKLHKFLRICAQCEVFRSLLSEIK